MKQIILFILLMLLVSPIVYSQRQRDTVIVYEPCPQGIFQWRSYKFDPSIEVYDLFSPDSLSFNESPRPIGGLPGIQKLVTYPVIAVKAGVEGSTCVSAFIDSTGYPRGVRVIKSNAEVFDSVSIIAVQRSRFLPAMSHGKPAGTTILVSINFLLKETRWSIHKPSLNVSEISLKHIPGMFVGPTYDIILRKGENATYIGHTQVDKIGIYSGYCPEYYYTKLESLLGWYCFFDSSYQQSIVLDMSDDIISAVKEGKKVTFSGSDTDFDERIWAIARLLDYIATKIDWQKTSDVPEQK